MGRDSGHEKQRRNLKRDKPQRVYCQTKHHEIVRASILANKTSKLAGQLKMLGALRKLVTKPIRMGRKGET